MNQITDDRQQQCLEKFFAKEKTWYPDYFGCKFAAYMMFFCGIIGWLFPYQKNRSFSFLQTFFVQLKDTSYTA